MQLYGSKDLGFRQWLPTNSSWLWNCLNYGIREVRHEALLNCRDVQLSRVGDLPSSYQG